MACSTPSRTGTAICGTPGTRPSEISATGSGCCSTRSRTRTWRRQSHLSHVRRMHARARSLSLSAVSLPRIALSFSFSCAPLSHLSFAVHSQHHRCYKLPGCAPSNSLVHGGALVGPRSAADVAVFLVFCVPGIVLSTAWCADQVCLRFALEVAHIRWEPRNDPLRGA